MIAFNGGSHMQDVVEAATEAVAEDAGEIEHTVEIPVMALAGFGGCFKFVGQALALAFSGRHMSRDELIDLAAQCGLKVLREPTEDELADPGWFGHELGIQAGEEKVWDNTVSAEAAADVYRHMEASVDESEADPEPESVQ